MTTPNILSTQETNRLLHLEAVIETHKQAFLEVGAALLEIQEKRLYREQYNTFEEYISEKHGIGRSTAYQYIKAAEVRQDLVENGVTELPQNEAQYRVLTSVIPERRAKVWEQTTQFAEQTGEKVTAKVLSAIADKTKPKVEVQEVEVEEVRQTLYIDVPVQEMQAPQPVREAGFGLGGIHKKTANPHQGKEVTSDLLRQIVLEKYVDGHVFINYHVLTTDLMQHCRELKMKPILHKLLNDFAKSLAASDLFLNDNGKLILQKEKPVVNQVIYPEKMYLIEHTILSSKNKLEEEIADFLRALDGDIVHNIEQFFMYMNDKIQTANAKYHRCKPLKKMDISYFYNHLKEVRIYTFLSSRCSLDLCDSITVKITPISPLKF